jgi:hypothetical protein
VRSLFLKKQNIVLYIRLTKSESVYTGGKTARPLLSGIELEGAGSEDKSWSGAAWAGHWINPTSLNLKKI